MGWRIGIDTGGTFTDLVFFHAETGEVATWKVSTTPKDPSGAAIGGILEGLERQRARPGEVTYVGHGTTVATNAFLERKGARTGLITTRGFRDLLELGRQARPHLYDLHADKHEVLIPGRLRIEVSERLDWHGREVEALDEAAVSAAARRLAADGVESVAICFLFSFLNPGPEQRARSLVAEHIPGAYVCASSDVIPEFREYERLATTALSAYLGPVVARYVDRLAERLAEGGLPVLPQIMQSNGGTMSVQSARTRAVETAFSGPAAGVIGAAFVARLAGFPNVITLDMGGTSADVAVVEAGRPKMTTASAIGPYPAKVPMIEVDTVGAGGGSLAYVDEVGALKVGPESAGAEPGPACYGRGGERPTVTDANVTLGRIGETGLLGGTMRLDPSAARRALTDLGNRMGLSLTEVSQGVLRIVNATMLRLIRKLSVQRGYDPRDYALVAFGGGGPLHAGDLAEELGISTVIVPDRAGVLSALGQLLADVRADFVRTFIAPVDEARVPEISAHFGELEERAEAWLAAEGVAPERRRVVRTADARYVGQNWELSIEIPAGVLTAAHTAEIAASFHAAHRRKYTYDLPGRPVELINCRITALGETTQPTLPQYPPAAAAAAAAQVGRRPVVWEGDRPIETPVYVMDRLDPGHRVAGPAIVEQFTATVAVRPGDTATVDQYRNLIIQVR